MNALYAHTALFYTAVLVFLAINVNALDRLSSGEIRSDRQGGRRRFLRSDQIDHTEGKELQMVISPKEIDVDPLSTYNEKFMALMNSPCRPELDGFFGATSGDPIRVQYGFKIEVQPLSAIMDILEAIEDKIVDSILQSSFPEMCGLHRARKTQESSRTILEQVQLEELGENSMTRVEKPKRSLAHTNGHPSGFRFLKFEEVEKCLPKENEVNFCGIFTGALFVYGKHQHGEDNSREIMSYINEVLDTSEPHDLHSELTLLSSVDKFSVIEGGYTNQSLVSTNYIRSGLSRLDALLIIISGLIVVAITYYVYIQWNERRHNDQKLPVENTKDLPSRISSEYEGNDNGEDVFIDEDLTFQPYRDNRKNSVIL